MFMQEDYWPVIIPSKPISYNLSPYTIKRLVFLHNVAHLSKVDLLSFTNQCKRSPIYVIGILFHRCQHRTSQRLSFILILL